METVLIILVVGLLGWPLVLRYDQRRGRRRYEQLLAYRTKYEPRAQSVSERNSERHAELHRLAQTTSPENPGGSALSRSVAQRAAAEQRKNAQAWLDAIRLHRATFIELDALVVDAAAELQRLGVPATLLTQWSQILPYPAATPYGWSLAEVRLEILRDGSQYRAQYERKGRVVGAEIDIPEYNTQDLQLPAFDPPLPWGVAMEPGSGLAPWYKDRLEGAIIRLARGHGRGL